jgi:hypothetical protein
VCRRVQVLWKRPAYFSSFWWLPFNRNIELHEEGCIFTLRKTSEIDRGSQPESDADEPPSATTSTLRRRKPPVPTDGDDSSLSEATARKTTSDPEEKRKDEGADGEEESNEDEDKDGHDSRSLPTDPIFQFSALPPPALREAQRGFLRSLEEIARCATMLHRLKGLESAIGEAKKTPRSTAANNSEIYPVGL